MSIPNHNLTCITKTIPTTCPDCKKEVFYFSCSCGSKTFFDQLGWPWEPHICKKYLLRQQLELIKTSDNMSDDDIYRAIEAIEKKHGREVDDTTLQMLEQIIGKRKYKLCIDRHEPVADTEFSGQIMSLDHPVNIAKKLGYDPAAPLIPKILKTILNQQWGVTVVRTRTNDKNECIEYILYFPTWYLTQHKFRQTDHVAGVARIHKHLNGKFLVIESHIRI